MPQRWAEEATRLLPRARLIVIPGAFHTVNFSSPLELVRVLRPFLLAYRHEVEQSTMAERSLQRQTERRGR